MPSAELKELISAAKHSVMDGKLPALTTQLKQAEGEVDAYSRSLPYEPHTDADVYAQQIDEYRAGRYAQHIHSFLLSIIEEESEALSGAIVQYLSNHSDVVYLGTLFAPSSGGPVTGATSGKIFYP